MMQQISAIVFSLGVDKKLFAPLYYKDLLHGYILTNKQLWKSSSPYLLFYYISAHCNFGEQIMRKKHRTDYEKQAFSFYPFLCREEPWRVLFGKATSSSVRMKSMPKKANTH